MLYPVELRRFNLASIKRDYLSLQTSTRPCDASASLPQSAAKFAFVPETTRVIVAPIKAEQRHVRQIATPDPV